MRKDGNTVVWTEDKDQKGRRGIFSARNIWKVMVSAATMICFFNIVSSWCITVESGNRLLPDTQQMLRNKNVTTNLPFKKDHKCRASRVYGTASQVYGTASQVYGTASQVYGTASQVYGTASQVYGTASQVYGTASQVYGTASQVHGPASQVYGTASQV